ncbi:DUF2170 family protein [Atlantibacter hermannii]|uniref:DUF2170 family protein n=1 Tax=Atlantibacter hermannii TaxID=565 RepID=UPI0011CE5169|nr:DUF2170 family protein [Atlantibacter hermannii]
MTWTVTSLKKAFSDNITHDYIVVKHQDILTITLKQYGDLNLHLSLTSKQILIETVICPVKNICDVNKLNYRLLRLQKILPLSSVGISVINHQDYYIAFGALSLSSSFDDILLEIETLANNALELAEMISEA